MVQKLAPEKAKAKEDTKDASTKATHNQSSIMIAVGVILIGVSLCFLGARGGSEPSSEDANEVEVIEANCSATECLAQIEVADSPEKITEVIGVEPEGGEDGEYKWKISNKESIAREKSGDSYILQATIDKEKLVNDTLDFSIFSELKQQLGKGESFSYDELVKKFNGVEGTLAGKTETSKRYIWVDNHDQTFGATFSNKDGQCSIITLR